MAETNLDTSQAQLELQKLAEAAANASREYASASGLSKESQQKLNDATIQSSTGIGNFGAKATLGVNALVGLGQAGMAAGKALYDGKKGASAMNGAMTGLTDTVGNLGIAISMMMGPLGLLVGAVALAIKAVGAYAAAANEMTDKLHKGYQDMAKSGAAAADGMSGLYDDAHKLGLGMNDLSDYTSLIAANAKDLTLFAGSVSAGRKQFADLGKTMEPYREGLMNLGMDQKEINEASMGYLRLQSRIGQTQNKSVDQLAASTQKYLVEQDALTKLTGMTRKEQEDAREEVRSQERFGAKMEQLRQQGLGDRADELEKAYLILKSKSKEAAQGFADLSTGMITTESARKLVMSDQGKTLEQQQKIIAGQQNAVGAVQEIATTIGKTTSTTQVSLSLMGEGNKNFIDFSQGLALKAAAVNNGLQKAADEIDKDSKRQKEGVDPLTKKQTEIALELQKGMKASEDFVRMGLGPAQEASLLLAKAARSAAEELNKAFGKGETAKPQELGFGPGKKAPVTAEDYEKLHAQKAGPAAPAPAASAPAASAPATVNTATPSRGGRGSAPAAPAASAPAASAPAASAPAASAPAAPAQKSASAPAAAASQSARGSPGATKTEINPLKFTGGTGSESNFKDLTGALQDAVIKAGTEYVSLTKNPLIINSAKRDSKDQERLYQETVDAGRPGIGPTGMAVGKPGRSKHEIGEAVDIQQGKDDAKAVNILGKYGLVQAVPKDPVHFQLSAETGIEVDGPDSGYPATLHGKEAVIPMQNGSGDFVKMFERIADSNMQMVAMMEEMVRSQKNSVDVQSKILRAQA